MLGKHISIFVISEILMFLLLVIWVPKTLLSFHNKDVETLYPGDSLILKTTGPVQVLAYANDVTSPSSLYDAVGNEVLRTTPEIVPGNFAVIGVLDEGVYYLKGEQTTFKFSKENFLSAENPRVKEINFYTGLFAWVLFNLMFVPVSIGSYRGEKLRKSS